MVFIVRNSLPNPVFAVEERIWFHFLNWIIFYEIEANLKKNYQARLKIYKEWTIMTNYDQGYIYLIRDKVQSLKWLEKLHFLSNIKLVLNVNVNDFSCIRFTKKLSSENKRN